MIHFVGVMVCDLNLYPDNALTEVSSVIHPFSDHPLGNLTEGYISGLLKRMRVSGPPQVSFSLLAHGMSHLVSGRRVVFDAPVIRDPQ